MPRTDEQLEQLREESRDRILTSALRLFARHGYAATSVRMIAVEAGVSQGLMYNYYAGKGALLRAIIERSMGDVQSSLAEASAASATQQGVEMLVRSAFAIVRRNRAFWQLSYQLRMQPDVLADLGQSVGAWADAIRLQIEALLRSAGSADAAVEARVLFAAIDGAAQHYVLDPEHYPLDEVADEIVRRFLPRRHGSPRGSTRT
jgi:AcrR family transcriptional regulator